MSCYCSEPIVTCGQADFPQCGGFCEDGELCVPALLGGACECEPLAPECDSSAAPVCGGFCSTGGQCEPDPSAGGACGCASCATAAPTGHITVVWETHTDLVWSGHECADSYNVYRVTFQRMLDHDGDGLADDYGFCLQGGLKVRRLTDMSMPLPGFAHAYLITGENKTGEGSPGWASNGRVRPNRSPCP
jgi:hypothetical protein